MKTQQVRTCFTISFSDDQYVKAQKYVQEMKKHPKRLFWKGKEGKTDEELIISQLAHRVLSGFYNDEPFFAGKQIIRMDSSVAV